MPDCYQPNDPRRIIPRKRPRAECGLPEDALVMCTFNQAVKIRRPVFEAWCSLLHVLPDSCLWLLDPGPAASERLRAFAGSRRVDPARVLFAPKLPGSDHLERLASADIALDTFPYTSHTTASDALWAGVPLITTYGDTFASRVAYSILAAAGCADWAFDDADEAFDATLAMARDPRRREEARARVDRARHSSPLFDARKFARDFENLIEAEVRRR
jgi:predicted O-linked N-acetylglucosamine transferase (SPINDLY family)